RAVFPAVEQTVQTMPPLRHRNQHARPAVAIENIPVQSILLAERLKKGLNLRQAVTLRAFEDCAHKKTIAINIFKLGRFLNVEAEGGEQGRYRSHQALGVLTTEG